MTQNTSLMRGVAGTREGDRGPRGIHTGAHSQPPSVASVRSVPLCFRTVRPHTRPQPVSFLPGDHSPGRRK
jgi:hypothetical protein